MHVAVRLVQINRALWGLLLWWALVRIGLLRPRRPPAERFAAAPEKLGTTFVKLGQGLNLHRDLLPDDYVAALQKLLFPHFEPQPLAAGSIAQVHRAARADGRAVIVKCAAT